MADELTNSSMQVAHRRGNPNMVKGQPSINQSGRTRSANRDPANVINGIPAMQKRLARFMKGKLTDLWLSEWFDDLQPREKLTFINVVLPYIFIKPQPPKDDMEKLTDEQFNTLYHNTMEAIKAVR